MTFLQNKRKSKAKKDVSLPEQSIGEELLSLFVYVFTHALNQSSFHLFTPRVFIPDFENRVAQKTRRIQKFVSVFIVLDFFHWISFIVATMYGEEISALVWIRFSSWPITY